MGTTFAAGFFKLAPAKVGRLASRENQAGIIFAASFSRLEAACRGASEVHWERSLRRAFADWQLLGGGEEASQRGY